MLAAYARPVKLLKQGKELHISGSDIFDKQWVEIMDIPDVGKMESYPNGDALKFIPMMNLGPELQEMGRYTTRWPGHCEFWRAMSHLGFFVRRSHRFGRGSGGCAQNLREQAADPPIAIPG